MAPVAGGNRSQVNRKGIDMDTKAKLTNVEAKMRRWHSRLTRAANMLAKLERQRRRLTGKPSLPKTKPFDAAEVFTVPVKPDPAPAVSVETDHIAETDLPAFLDRRNPDGIRKAAAEMQAQADAQLVDTLKARRADKTEADKHKMPLTGRAAIDYLKVTPKTKKARRKGALVDRA
jgi:hypothetical protein